MNTWQDIHSTALVGTERKSLDAGSSDDNLGLLLQQLTDNDHEGALLAAAGMTALWRQAGLLSMSSDEAVTPSEPDELPRCSNRASIHLASILSDNYRSLLPEWLAAAGQVALRLPEEHLPTILELGRHDTSLRPFILPLLGHRGRWLAALNSDWRWVAPREETETWETGTAVERKSMLEQLRGTAPDRARELLRSGWNSNPARERATLLETLRIGLSYADEAFLESTLDDRSKEVRAAAVDLLARLPDSAFVRRMTERAPAILEWKAGGLLKKSSIVVHIPDEFDETMIRDGIAPASKKGEFVAGEKATWLAHALELMPPMIWCALWEKTPAEIIAATASNDWKSNLLSGWGAAALRCNAVDWIEALLVYVSRAEEVAMQTTRGLSAGELMGALPGDRLEHHVIAMLRSDTSAHSSSYSTLRAVQICVHPWSNTLADAFFAYVRRTMKSGAAPDLQTLYMQAGSTGNTPSAEDIQRVQRESRHLQQVSNIFVASARFISPDLLESLEPKFQKDAERFSAWEGAINDFLQLLRFRRDMLNALQNERNV